MIRPEYSVSFVLSINIFEWQNVLYFLDAPRTRVVSNYVHLLVDVIDCKSNAWNE